MPVVIYVDLGPASFPSPPFRLFDFIPVSSGGKTSSPWFRCKLTPPFVISLVRFFTETFLFSPPAPYRSFSTLFCVESPLLGLIPVLTWSFFLLNIILSCDPPFFNLSKCVRFLSLNEIFSDICFCPLPLPLIPFCFHSVPDSPLPPLFFQFFFFSLFLSSLSTGL